MSAPSEKHMEAARKVRSEYQSHSEWFLTETTVRVIATALANAEREGMKRAAEIASEFDDEDILIGKDAAEIIRNTILSEAGEA